MIALAPDEFIIAGTGIVVTFAPVSAGDPIAGILTAQEGRVVDGQWRTIRWLNGHQTHQGRQIRLEPNAFTMRRVQAVSLPLTVDPAFWSLIGRYGSCYSCRCPP